MSTNISLATFVREAQNGKIDAWKTLYEETKRDSYYIAIKMCHSENDAEELVHDAYVLAMQRIFQLENPEKFSAWMNKIVCNRCKDYLKKRKPILFTELERDDDIPLEFKDDREYTTPHSILDHNETTRLVKEMIEDLPADQKLCILLYYKDELSIGEIAKTLGLSEGTIKSRLNYGRLKVKERVLTMERRGVKLYNLAPMVFFSWLIKDEAMAMELPHDLDIAINNMLKNTAAKSSFYSSDAEVHKTITTAEMGQAGSILGAVGVKTIASVLAVCLGVGGFAFYKSNDSSQTTSDFTNADTADAAIAAYEGILTNGKSESGFDILYYAYIDLNQDDIPELLVSNHDGSENEWNEGDIYTFENNKIHFCGFTDSRYMPFYLVNDTYVMGQWRLGTRFIGVEESIETCYHTEKLISFNGEDQKKITEEEWNYYNDIPTGEARPVGFIKTVTPIELMKNDFLQKNGFIRVPVSSDTVTEYYSIDSYVAEWTYGDMLEILDANPDSGFWHEPEVERVFFVNDASGDLQSSEKDPYNALVLLTSGGYILDSNDPDNGLYIEVWYMHIFPNFYKTDEGYTYMSEQVEHIWLNPDEVFVPASEYVYQFFEDYDVEEVNADDLLNRYN